MRIGRRQREIEPTSTRTGRTAHEELILRGENDRGEMSEIVGEARDTFAIAHDFFAACAKFDEHLCVAAAFMREFAGDGRFGLSICDERAIVGCAKGAERKKKTGGFEQIGFPLTVGTDKKMAVALKAEIRERDVTKVLKRDPAKAHQTEKGEGGSVKRETPERARAFFNAGSRTSEEGADMVRV